MRDGSFMRVQLVDFQLVIPFGLAGVACPSFRGKGVKLADGSYDDSAAKPEPFAAMARTLSNNNAVSTAPTPTKFRIIVIHTYAYNFTENVFFSEISDPFYVWTIYCSLE